MLLILTFCGFHFIMILIEGKETTIVSLVYYRKNEKQIKIQKREDNL